MECEALPQGTMTEKMRIAAAGLGGFYSKVGVGTTMEEGKEKRIFDGEEYILETPLSGDFALVHAYKADRLGNLVYKGTSRNFNPIMAAAARITIVEVEELVEIGELDPGELQRIDPEEVVTPGVYVQRIVHIPESKLRTNLNTGSGEMKQKLDRLNTIALESLRVWPEKSNVPRRYRCAIVKSEPLPLGALGHPDDKFRYSVDYRGLYVSFQIEARGRQNLQWCHSVFDRLENDKEAIESCPRAAGNVWLQVFEPSRRTACWGTAPMAGPDQQLPARPEPGLSTPAPSSSHPPPAYLFSTPRMPST